MARIPSRRLARHGCTLYSWWRVKTALGPRLARCPGDAVMVSLRPDETRARGSAMASMTRREGLALGAAAALAAATGAQAQMRLITRPIPKGGERLPVIGLG